MKPNLKKRATLASWNFITKEFIKAGWSLTWISKGGSIWLTKDFDFDFFTDNYVLCLLDPSRRKVLSKRDGRCNWSKARNVHFWKGFWKVCCSFSPLVSVCPSDWIQIKFDLFCIQLLVLFVLKTIVWCLFVSLFGFLGFQILWSAAVLVSHTGVWITLAHQTIISSSLKFHLQAVGKLCPIINSEHVLIQIQ